MEFPVSRLAAGYDFCVNGVSYAGAPRSHTALFITAKVPHLLENLRQAEECLVFLQTGMTVPEELRGRHCFLFSDSPQLEYARFAEQFECEKEESERKLRYLFREPGYYVSETAVIGEDAYIEPGCIIGHHVVIGDHARILAGSVIKNARIGDWFYSNEGAVIGANGFTMAVDEAGNKIRIPTLGSVRIGDHVEIGVLNNISRGSGGDTVLEDYVKLDALVHVAHDVHLQANAEIAAGTIFGGFAGVGQNTFLGLNATVKNRVAVGSDALIGMGAAVIRPVDDGVVAAGNPARPLVRHSEGK